MDARMIMGLILICCAVTVFRRCPEGAKGPGAIIRRAVCVQCMLTAMGSVAAASGTRTWLGRKRADWLTPKRLRFITVALFVGAVLVAGTMSGSGGS